LIIHIAATRWPVAQKMYAGVVSGDAMTSRKRSTAFGSGFSRLTGMLTKRRPASVAARSAAARS
jgi:hypothetical protein